MRELMRELAEELIPGLRPKRLRDEESAKKQKSILEALAKEGVEALELSDISRKTRKKARKLTEWSSKYGSNFIVLYDGEHSELMNYTVALGQDVMDYIKEMMLAKIREVIDKSEPVRNKYENVAHVLHMSNQLMPDNLRPDTHGFADHKAFYWLENPHKSQDTEYLQELVLKIENALARSEILAVESVHKVKLEPEFIAARGPIGSFSLIINYHLKKE